MIGFALSNNLTYLQVSTLEQIAFANQFSVRKLKTVKKASSFDLPAR